jgi:hypothetical protein
MKTLWFLLKMPWFGLKVVGVIIHWIFLFAGYTAALAVIGGLLRLALLFPGSLSWGWVDGVFGLVAAAGASWDTYGLITYWKRNEAEEADGLS